MKDKNGDSWSLPELNTRIQEKSLALLKNAVAHRMEAINAKKPKPMIKETPATRKSNMPKPITIIVAIFFLCSSNYLMGKVTGPT